MSQEQTTQEEAFEMIGRAIADQLTQTMGEHVESAEEKLADENLVAFALVAVREGDDGLEGTSQRAIDPEVVHESEREPDAVVEDLHNALCQIFDERIVDR